ncbi:MAG: 5-(carboxyamino)imidazole ribonucleotide synthase [Pseudomonadota bacterium]
MKIGILGAGQLGRMLALAGYPLDFDFVFLDPATEACAAPLGTHIHADFDDERALQELCVSVDVATFEFENVSAHSAEFVAARIPLYPSPKALTAGQDRLHEKKLFAQLGIPVPGNIAVSSLDGLRMAVEHLGLPCVLKTRRMGYDGKGQAVLRAPEDIATAWEKLGSQPLILEAFIPFERELSCLAVRAQNGEMRFYPLVENVHRDGILRTAIPTDNEPLQGEGEDYARRVAEHLDYVGVLAFEFFVAGGKLLANEIAPRVHNSGHWSIEGAEVSQFENHLRAVAALPLGATALRGSCAMVNLIGGAPPAPLLLALDGVHVHNYGKTPKPQRKIGHVTVTAATREQLMLRLAPVQALVEQYAQ